MTEHDPVERFGRFIEEHAMKSGFTMSDIATLAGFSSAEVLRMLISGEARIPLDRIGPLAAVIDCDAGQLFVLAMRTWFTQETMAQIEEHFITVPEQSIETRWMTAIRNFYNGNVPELTVRTMNKLYAALRTS